MCTGWSKSNATDKKFVEEKSWFSYQLYGRVEYLDPWKLVEENPLLSVIVELKTTKMYLFIVRKKDVFHNKIEYLHYASR